MADEVKTAAPARNESQWSLIRRRFARHRVAVVSMVMLGILYFLAVFAEPFAPYTPFARDLDHAYCPPQPPRFSFRHGLYVHAVKQHVDRVTYKKTYVEDRSDIVRLGFFVKGEPYRIWGLIPWDRHVFGVIKPDRGPDQPRATFFMLGADQFGRDLLSRILYGSRISLSIGLVSIAVTFILGLAIGGISGYIGGRTDTLIQRFMEIVSSFPGLPLWLALAAAMPADWSPLRVYFAITVVLSLLGWTGLARVVRGKILSLREEDYAVAARLVGASHSRIIFRHLLPGFTSHIIVTVTLSVPGMILGETSLSFLGLGLRPPVVSWGVMLQDCMNIQTVGNYPWVLITVVFVIGTVLSFNFLGDGLRDAADPYSGR